MPRPRPRRLRGPSSPPLAGWRGVRPRRLSAAAAVAARSARLLAAPQRSAVVLLSQPPPLFPQPSSASSPPSVVASLSKCPTSCASFPRPVSPPIITSPSSPLLFFPAEPRADFSLATSLVVILLPPPSLAACFINATQRRHRTHRSCRHGASSLALAHPSRPSCVLPHLKRAGGSDGRSRLHSLRVATTDVLMFSANRARTSSSTWCVL